MSEDNDDPFESGLILQLFLLIFQTVFGKLILPFFIVPLSKFLRISHLWAGILILSVLGVIYDAGFSNHSLIKYTYHLVSDRIESKSNYKKSIKISSDLITTKKYPYGLYTGERPQKDRLYKGSLIYNNGYYYEGEWKDEKKEGDGLFIIGESKFMCFFADDLPNGRGLYYSQFSIANVIWEKGEITKGIMSYSNNNIFIGTFDESVYWKKGTVILANGIRESGEWNRGIRNGYFIFIYTNGDRFEGIFINGKNSGQGKYYYTNGDTYIGEFENMVRHGDGTYFFKNGDKVIGIWKNGKIENGKKIYHNGKIEEI